MPPADNTPDFDKMSPEELMAWMETLAKRQGADEGFTTSANMQIAEIDPATVSDTGPGYIPYGMTQEQWEKKQADEAAKKAARQSAAPASTPPAAAPVAAPAASAPSAPAPAASAGDMPDFDKMSPDELMAWMETLAKRQGADEGFTTSADMQIAEVDPATVADTGPGYIPYGMTQEQWEKKQADEAAKKAARQSSAPPPAAAPPPAPELVPAAPATPSFDLPRFETTDMEATTELVSPEANEGLAWLESLASNPGVDLPTFDLSGIGNELPPLDLDSLGGQLDLSALDALAEPQAEAENPLDWLQGLSGAQDNPFDLPPLTPQPSVAPPEPVNRAVSDPTDSNVDPLEWLESLALRQGADAEELTTAADFNVPLPAAEAPSDVPGYTGYRFEEDSFDFNATPELDVDALDEVTADDPVAWLDQLASAQNAEAGQTGRDNPQSIIEEAKSDRVMQALSSGQQVAPEEIKGFLDTLMDAGAALSDDTGFVVDEEEAEPTLQAQIPDWLLDQVGPPPVDLNAPRKTEQPPLIDQIVEPQAVDLPDWLSSSMDEQVDPLGSLFADEEEATPTPAAAAPAASLLAEELQVDTNDPWVEAFELERQMGELNVDQVPDWYAERLSQLQTGEFSPVEGAQQATLQQANLPVERDVPAGEPEALPDWLGATAGATPITEIGVEASGALPFALEDMDEEPAAVSELPDWLQEQFPQELSPVSAISPVEDDDLPDWLREAGVEKTDTVPDWLIDTITVEVEQPETVAQTIPQPPAPVPAVTVPTVAAASPAPVPVAAAQIDLAGTLQSARSRISSGDFTGGLQDYETIVRANLALDAVVGDLSGLLKQEGYKSNASLYRVLGDGLMRQGRLQEALDTYRRALNLL
ncbi:MAG: tetratricopeptide repeat protein [bacterium]|nr:tetratricopeptide repeat protein [bacterium]